MGIGLEQLIIEGSIQALKRLYDDAKQSSESEVLHVFELFRPLAFDIIDKADHHSTPCREPYPKKYHYMMVPEVPNQLSALVTVNRVKWRLLLLLLKKK